ncbi:hypothetical protein PF049_14075 (plasmid) [Erythrobacteraceae bacterium WH01K]|nr:hypothetical protein PF049_14075 [Erythrobacteraceae bacterium WH01K]
MASKKLVELHPPLTGLFRRLHLKVAQTQAEGLITLNVPLGASTRQISAWHFLADPWNLSPEDMQLKAADRPRRLGQSRMTNKVISIRLFY